MQIEIMFLNGTTLTVECDEFEYKQSMATGKIESMNIKGIKDNKPFYIDTSQIMVINRKITKEDLEYGNQGE